MLTEQSRSQQVQSAFIILQPRWLLLPRPWFFWISWKPHSIIVNNCVEFSIHVLSYVYNFSGIKFYAQRSMLCINRSWCQFTFSQTTKRKCQVSFFKYYFFKNYCSKNEQKLIYNKSTFLLILLFVWLKNQQNSYN